MKQNLISIYILELTIHLKQFYSFFLNEYSYAGLYRFLRTTFTQCVFSL